MRHIAAKTPGGRVGRRRPLSARRGGFTLMEVLLAVGLSTMLLSTLGMAIHVFVRLTDQSRTQIEEIRLARHVLNLIASDLQNAVLDQPQDMEARIVPLDVVAKQESEVLYDDDGNPVDEYGNLLDANGDPVDENGYPIDEETLALQQAALEEAEALAAEEEEDPVLPPPAFYGDVYQLFFDVDKTPRYFEIEYFMQQYYDQSQPEPMDFRTVGYFVRSGDLYDPFSTTPLVNLDESLGGLVRRSMNRVDSSNVENQMELGEYNETEQLLAPEIVYIQFHYFDGTDWLEEWDSAESHSLPTAVEVTIGITPIRDGLSSEDSTEAESVDEAAQADDLVLYHEIVLLRAANTTDDEAEEEETN